MRVSNNFLMNPDNIFNFPHEIFNNFNCCNDDDQLLDYDHDDIYDVCENDVKI